VLASTHCKTRRDFR